MDDSMEDFDYTDGETKDQILWAAHFKEWFRCVGDCVFLVLLLCACFFIFFIQKNYNRSICIQLIILFIGYTIFAIHDIWKLVYPQ